MAGGRESGMPHGHNRCLLYISILITTGYTELHKLDVVARCVLNSCVLPGHVVNMPKALYVKQSSEFKKSFCKTHVNAGSLDNGSQQRSFVNI